MRVWIDDYILAYSDGKKELNFPLAQPVALSEILTMGDIPVWESFQLSLNQQPVTDLAIQVSDVDEVRILPRLNK